VDVDASRCGVSDPKDVIVAAAVQLVALRKRAATPWGQVRQAEDKLQRAVEALQGKGAA